MKNGAFCQEEKGGDQEVAAMEEGHPPPVFDWLSEPPRIIDTGKAWLVPGPVQDVEVELCSVMNSGSVQPEEGDSESDEELEDYETENLFCPTGYRCQIDHLGDLDNGIPDTGHCVLEDGVEEPEDIADDAVPTTTTCLFEGTTYTTGDTFRYENNNCFCRNGEVDCIVH
ncbi:unnamed protein product [Owenia fusiformis]|uniref:Uncharacterized protein n=1 Tax=Owenia fusiformis TaxID=6347 RepID=A0A8J1TS85_OWEFU|nr:unnamed protein product [Owenia fusiformis]